MYPNELGFKMPAEWEKHSQTFMEWPLKEAEWPEPFSQILPAFTKIVTTIADFEPVTLIVKPGLSPEAAEYVNHTSPKYKIQILEIEHNDSWMRDNGPTFVVNSNGEIAGINWKFNAWGGKYPYEKDNEVAPKILSHLGISRFDAPFVLEGGSVHVDGEGTLLTTEECLLNKNRNPQLSKEGTEKMLKAFLGIEKVIWLKRGLFGDDTDGHIDNVACFAKPGLVIMQNCSDPNDPNFEIAKENRDLLRSATDAQGRKLEIILVEQPPAVYYGDHRLTLSYLNFYFVNGGIILPLFSGRTEDKATPLSPKITDQTMRSDEAATALLEQIFPDRKVITIDGLQVARGGGNVHCLTQQMPAT